ELPSLPRCAFDAVVGFDVALDEPFLRDTLALLRPGGRLITIDSSSDPDEQPLKALEAAGYVRILVETGAECPLPVGTLARGERVHETEDTLERVRVSVGGEQADTALANYKGRFLHLLIQQTPNLPVWKLEPGQSVEWRAAALQNASGPALLAFSSLPAAVAFMQEAVLSGLVQGISKIAKFRRATALGWTHPVLLNPSLETAIQGAVAFIDIDPSSAEQPDE
ncbi:MAG: hypothetical protein JNL42_08810, partial [Anaerolineae bacterium]|nr:hypothetical protein [Anaerolineae bacterium]